MTITRRNFCLTLSSAWFVAMLPGKVKATQDPVIQKLEELYPNEELVRSEKIVLRVPQIAENSMVVPINVDTGDIPVDWMSWIAPSEHYTPLVWFECFGQVDNNITTRVKMSRSGPFAVVVSTEQGLFYNSGYIKVITGGGCM